MEHPESAIPYEVPGRSDGAADPIRERYELIVLERGDDDRLELITIPLFLPGARCEDRKRFRIRCATSDDYGTAFAVVACERPQDYRLISMQSGKLQPRMYYPTAELIRPGEVRFLDLPVMLREDSRRWNDVVAAVPDRLDRVGPTHLILAVETSGDPYDVGERLDRARQLLRRAADGADDQLRVSLLSYGPHAVPDREADIPVRTLAWAATPEEGLAQLAVLAEEGAASLGYWRAAKLECLLTELATRVSDADGRPVLVTIGSRPAFPPRTDRVSEIIPCPRKRDWDAALSRLRAHADIAFGAIRDHGRAEGLWGRLGSTTFARLSTVDVRRFAADLGLLATAQTLPLPLTAPDGG